MFRYTQLSNSAQSQDCGLQCDFCLRWQRGLKRKKESGSFSQSTVRSAGVAFNRTTPVWDEREQQKSSCIPLQNPEFPHEGASCPRSWQGPPFLLEKAAAAVPWELPTRAACWHLYESQPEPEGKRLTDNDDCQSLLTTIIFKTYVNRYNYLSVVYNLKHTV